MYRFKAGNNICEASILSDSSYIEITGPAPSGLGIQGRYTITITLMKKDKIPVFARIYNYEEYEDYDFLSASLKFVHNLYPSVTQFKFTHDIMNYLYLARNGTTWYQDKFNARHVCEERQKAFEEAAKILFQPKNMSYEDFKDQHPFSKEENMILEPLYNSTVSWVEFFRLVPDDTNLIVLSFFINNLINYTFLESDWIIDIENMSEIDLYDDRITKRSNRRSGSFGNIEAYKDDE
jgi:hypothetical protein